MDMAQPRGLEETQDDAAGDRFTNVIKSRAGRTPAVLFFNVGAIHDSLLFFTKAVPWKLAHSRGKLCGDKQSGDSHQSSCPRRRRGWRIQQGASGGGGGSAALPGKQKTSFLCGLSTFQEGWVSSGFLVYLIEGRHWISIFI